MKKIIFVVILIFVLVFIIYQANDNELIDYMSLGDSINEGINSYGNHSYGYNDYLKSYLENNDLLHKYNAYYSKNNYTIIDLLDDINDNKSILYDDKNYNIKKELREADLVTIAIGMDELVEILNNNDLSNFTNIKSKLDTLVNNMDSLLKNITSLSKTKIVLIGYYNPYEDSKELNRIFAYLNDKYQSLANKYKIIYVDIYNIIKQDKNYLPNDKDYHLTSRGYLKIANEVIKKIEKNL